MMETRKNIFTGGLGVSDLTMVSLLSKSTGSLTLQQEGAWLTNMLVTYISRLSSTSRKFRAVQQLLYITRL